jgi:hypothetical protein
MTSFENFRRFVRKNRANITVKGTPAKWPYDYNNNTAYIVTLDNITQYFYFNSDGNLLARNIIK